MASYDKTHKINVYGNITITKLINTRIQKKIVDYVNSLNTELIITARRHISVTF